MNPDVRSADGDAGVRERVARSVLAAAFVRWLEAATGLAVLTAVGTLGIAAAWPPARTVAFVGWVGLALLVVLFAVAGSLERTARADDVDRLTLASWITLSRGAALALFVGLLAVGTIGSGTTGVPVVTSTPATDPFAWLPALLFAAAGLLDAVDGAVARRTETVTAVGARLDVELDGLTTIVGAVAVVALSGAHAVFLAVGAARYLYVWSLWLRRRRDRPVRALPPSRIRAPLSAAVLVAIWIILAPIPIGDRSVLLTTAVAVPFLLNFLYDWLVVTARLPR